MRILLLVVGLLILGGCSTLSKQECVQGRWYDIGRSDGRNGYANSRFDSHREACQEYGIMPDSQEYYRGREIGLREYCTPENGLKRGKSGDYYHDVCPAFAEARFLKNFNLGKEIYELNSRIQELERKIDKQEAELRKSTLSDQERATIRARISDYYRELSSLRRTVSSLESLGVI